MCVRHRRSAGSLQLVLRTSQFFVTEECTDKTDRRLEISLIASAAKLQAIKKIATSKSEVTFLGPYSEAARVGSHYSLALMPRGVNNRDCHTPFP